MRQVRWTLLSSGALLVFVAAASCSNFAGDCGNKGECFSDAGAGGDADSGRGGGSSGVGSTQGGRDSSGGSSSKGDGGEGGLAGGDGGGGGRGPGTCDVNESPSVASCLVDESYAIFVDPEGDDEAQGTRTEPVGSIAHAIELATEQDKIVIACSATFDEQIAISTTVRLYGGFGCANSAAAWVYDARLRTVVAPTARGFALDVRDVREPVIVEDVEFQAQAAVEPGESSIAAFISKSDAVTLRRVRLGAAAGQDGADGSDGMYTFPEAEELAGRAGTAVSGGMGDACTCPSGATTTRGAGGGLVQNGGLGLPDYDGDGTQGDGGVSSLDCGAGGSGLRGAPGPSAPKASGATALGKWTDMGWTPAAGSNASAGSVGQGGGGGAGKTTGGGSGGCGGCGGRGGTGGRGGGASIGLVSIESTVLLESVEIDTANAGSGGRGGAGQAGQAGGTRGLGFGAVGCDGGLGGNGGNGGHGGGGAGGISVGVLFTGSAPNLDDTVVTLGMAGSAGPGGGSDGLAGIAGVAVSSLRAP